MAQERQILGYKPDGTPIEGPPLTAPPTTMTVGQPFPANLESLGGPAQPRYKDPLDADRRDQFNAEIPVESSFSFLDFFKDLLASPGKAVQLGKDALKAKVDYDLGVVDQVASGARSAASAVYDFGRDLKTELPNTTAKQGLQALSNFGEGVTGEAIADYGEEGKSRLGDASLLIGAAAGMIGGEGEVAGARRIGRGLYSRLDDAFKLIPDKPLHPNAIMNLFKKAPGGVSTEEMAYRGVPEFLAGHGDKPVSRAALAAHLEANPAPFPKVKTLGHEPNKQAAWKRLEAAQEDMSNLQAELAKDGTVPQIDRANLPWIAQEIAKGDEASKLAQRKFDAIPRAVRVRVFNN